MPVQYDQMLEITRESGMAPADGGRSSVDRGNGLRTRGSRSDRYDPGVGTGADPERTSARPHAAPAGGNATLRISRAEMPARVRIVARGVAEATSVRRPSVKRASRRSPWTNPPQSIEIGRASCRERGE